MAAVATHVTLKRVTEPVAAHMDGEHDVVQENHPAVAAGINCPGY